VALERDVEVVSLEEAERGKRCEQVSVISCVGIAEHGTESHEYVCGRFVSDSFRLKG